MPTATQFYRTKQRFPGIPKKRGLRTETWVDGGPDARSFKAHCGFFAFPADAD